MRKSVGAENTFARDLTQWDEVGPVLEPVFAKVWAACARGGHAGRTVTVKVKYADFEQITRSRSSLHPIASQGELERTSLELLRPYFPSPRGIRLLSVTISNLTVDAPETRPLLHFLLDTAAEAFDAGQAPDHVA